MYPYSIKKKQRLFPVKGERDSDLVLLTKTKIRGSLSYIVENVINYGNDENGNPIIGEIDIGFFSANKVPLKNGETMLLWQTFDRDGDIAGPEERTWQDAVIQLIRYFA